MYGNNDIQLYPTKGCQNELKLRLEFARKSFVLLKKKSDGLKIHFQDICEKLVQNKIQLGQVMKNAHMSLAEVKFVAGDIGKFVLENVDKAQIRIISKKEKVSGVQWYRLLYTEVNSVDTYKYLCLAKGGQQVAKAKQNYKDAIKLLVQLSSLQRSFVILDEAIRNTNRHVSALKLILIPRLERMVLYITSELDEYERDEFYRLKMMRNKRKKRNEMFSLIKSTTNAATANSILKDFEETSLLF